MTSYAPIPIGDGKFCYSGPNCKRHGVKKSLFKSAQDVFKRVDKEKASATLEVEVAELDFQNEAKEFFAKLAPQEKLALHRYSDRSGSVRVNRTLEAQATPTGDVKELVDNLDSAFAKQDDRTPRTVYRGITTPVPEAWLQEGSVIESLPYMSTSLSASKAFEFSSKKKPVILKVLSAKGGVPVLVHENEFELLLPRNQNYKVVSVQANIALTTSTPNYSAEIKRSGERTRANATLITLEALN